jgi:hypothetical protein
MYPLKRLFLIGHKNSIKHKNREPPYRRFSNNPNQKNLQMSVHLKKTSTASFSNNHKYDDSFFTVNISVFQPFTEEKEFG